MKKYYQIGLSCVFSIFLTLNVVAQNISISGSVIDEATAEFLPGVTVVEVGTTNGTVTNAEGYYTIIAPSNASLQFSFIGYEPVVIEVRR